MEADIQRLTKKFFDEFHISSDQVSISTPQLQYIDLPPVVLDVQTPSQHSTPRKLYNELTRPNRVFVGAESRNPGLVHWNSSQTRIEVIHILHHWKQLEAHKVRQKAASFRFRPHRPANTGIVSKTHSGSSPETSSLHDTPNSSVLSPKSSSAVSSASFSSISSLSPSTPTSPSLDFKHPQIHQVRQEVGLGKQEEGKQELEAKTETKANDSEKQTFSSKLNSESNNRVLPSSPHNNGPNRIPESQPSPDLKQTYLPKHLPVENKIEHEMQPEVSLGPLNPTIAQAKSSDDRKIDDIVKKLPDLSFMLA